MKGDPTGNINLLHPTHQTAAISPAATVVLATGINTCLLYGVLLLLLLLTLLWLCGATTDGVTLSLLPVLRITSVSLLKNI